MNPDWCTAEDESVRLTVLVVPNAAKSQIMGIVEGALRIRIRAKPVEGAANAELIRFLAEQLAVPKSALTLLRGQTGRRKQVAIQAAGINADRVRRTLIDATSNP